MRAIIDDINVDSIVQTIAIGGFKNGFAPIKKMVNGELSIAMVIGLFRLFIKGYKWRDK